MKTNRREFVKTASAAALGLTMTSAVGKTLDILKQPWGVQLFTIPQMTAKDFVGTMEFLGTTGYREIEFFGPYAFSSPVTIERWKGISSQLGISQNAFYGHSIKDVRNILKDNKLSTPSVHLDINTMRTHMDTAMENLSELGTRYVAIPAILNPGELNTLDDYRKLADEFNGFGKQMAKHGITFVYHNHGYEQWSSEGTTPMNILIENTDPETVKFELDIFWMTAGGGNPIDFLQKYPGRYKLMHLKDAKTHIRFEGQGKTPDEWMALFPQMSDPGDGVFDIPSIVQAGIESGVKHFYLERDLTPTPKETLANSYSYFSAI